MYRFPRPVVLLLSLAVALGPHTLLAEPYQRHDHSEDEDSAPQRAHAAERVEWRAAGVADTLHVKLLAINDFHGQLSAGRFVAGRPVGSAPVLAAWLKAAQAGREQQTILVHAGDHVGATPPASARTAAATAVGVGGPPAAASRARTRSTSIGSTGDRCAGERAAP